MTKNKEIEYPKVVYLEAILMANREVLHYGKSLGFINDEQSDLVESEATRLSKSNEVIVDLKVA